MIDWTDPALIALITLLVAGSGLALGIRLFPRLARERQGYPFEAEVEAALLPVVYQGIMAAYRTSERAMDEIAARIRGADKKRLADTIYALIPDVIVVQGKAVPVSIVKSLIPRRRFEELVQLAFDEFDEQYIAHAARWDRLFEEWLAGNAPPPHPTRFEEG